MAKQRSAVEVIPSARRLIRSLRDVGYDFKQAVADLIDNSIAAGASNIAIKMHFDGEDSWLRIADNGSGMTGATITEAMRFGSERDYEADELGKFGLGLKTASLSQCSRLTVGSRVDSNSRRIEVRQWDMAHVEKTNRWEIIDVPADERPGSLTQPLQDKTGTVVLWQMMDRVLGYKVPWGDRAKAGFYAMAEELDLHIGMVFHRFLAGETRRKKRKIKITLNDTNIEPWDPFAREEKGTLKLSGQQFEIHGDDGLGLVAYTPYILPSQERFSSPKAFARYSGPNKWNYQQGFYIYRADRMIQSGGWSRMRTSDEHTKFARVALDFMPDLDSAFDINVAKARVNLPADLRAQLQTHVEHLTKQARKSYSPPSEPSRTAIPTVPSNARTSTPTNTSLNTDSSGASSTSGAHNGDVIPASTAASSRSVAGNNGHIGNALEDAAKKAGELTALHSIRKALRIAHPQTADEIGW